MFVYNVTCKVSWQIHEHWLQWMQEKHIPEVMKSNCFERFQFLRLLDVDEEDGPTYTVQYYVESKSLYNRYIAQHAPALREDAIQKWGNQFIAFRTFMQVVN